MILNDILAQAVQAALQNLYSATVDTKSIQLQKTRREFQGDITLVVFPLLRATKKSPEQSANEIGSYLVEHAEQVVDFNVVKGFLNIVVSDSYYLDFLNQHASKEGFGLVPVSENSQSYMVEYSSPNTNKPLHLGHIRNNLLGYSLCKVLEANGKKVVKTNIVNDRGIHICKSMIAWKHWGDGATPESAKKKGDHLVGDYYVKFDQEYKKQISHLISQGKTEDEAKTQAPLLLEAQEMLRKWESKDSETIELWKKMNQWVYDGFDVTYDRLGVSFDKIYYESDTYLVGRDTVLKGLEKGLFKKREDGSVWADLTKEGLDEKILLRSDGTSVYMTQDIGTAQLRQEDYQPNKMVYVVGNEQNYHFKVLALILDQLGYEFAKDLYHMSYGMVELPEGKMKSREGTVVDADDLMDEMIATAKEMSDELGKLDGLSEEEKQNTFRIIGLGALKYFILKVDPTKNMTFDPKESIDFNGNTGPFIQYTYARICSIFRKAADNGVAYNQVADINLKLSVKEKGLLRTLHEFPGIVEDAGNNYSPAIIANYAYELVKEYNQFYHDHAVLKEENESVRSFRLQLSEVVKNTVKVAMNLLGIEMPERM